jgi:hypothetical protein
MNFSVTAPRFVAEGETGPEVPGLQRGGVIPTEASSSDRPAPPAAVSAIPRWTTNHEQSPSGPTSSRQNVRA